MVFKKAPNRELFYYLNKLMIGGKNNKKPIITAINVVNITAPTAISFAIPTSFEYLFLYIASSENSKAELTISEQITPEIVNSKIQIFVIEKFKHTAKIKIKSAAQK